MDLRQALTLYTCHALSTWTARSYEFAAILFAASAFPNHLRAPAFVGIANSVAAVLFGPTIGRWVNHGQSRLRPLLTTIFVNKCAITIACIFWQFIIQEKSQPADDREAEVLGENSAPILTGAPKLVTFGLILLLGLLESLSRKANLIAIERDWVPVLAPSAMVEGRTLASVNAAMGRIDMICKMLAPPAISQLLVIASPRLVVLFFIFGPWISFFIELKTAERLYKRSEDLQQPRSSKPGASSTPMLQQHRFEPRDRRPLAAIHEAISINLRSLHEYFGTEVWAPSLAMCITHSSILSLTGVTVVFFLDSGYSMQLLSVAEMFSAFCEFASTFATPAAVHTIANFMPRGSAESTGLTMTGGADTVEEDFQQGEAKDSTSAAVNTALTHTGLYGIALMLAFLLPAMLLVIYIASALSYPMARYSSNKSPTFDKYPVVSCLLLATLALSRLGRGVFSLTTQQLGQSRITPEFRSTFAGVEMSLISLFGLGHNVGAAIVSDPRDFGTLAVASWMSLLCSTLLYLYWIKVERIEWAWWRTAYR